VADREHGVRLGIALSGGGFRASLFHIGVLARLAELDILRKVEVISTVSGGSIVGALYYLHVKNLLEAKTEAEIQALDYVEIVKAVEEDFLAAVKDNVRARIFLNLRQNFHMASPRYSRTDRIGDILDRILYRPVWHGPLKRRWLVRKQQIRMRDLLIQPVGEPASFDPADDNPKLEHFKVPTLLVNATTLNTGRNWRLEAVRMGEPVPDDPIKQEAVQELDTTFRLAQGYFEPREGRPRFRKKPRNIPVGIAVAASAAVPAAFHPVAISNAYDGISVELVDGGVHDNQGIQALYDTSCTHLIASDASGQLRDNRKPSTRIPGVAARALLVYGARLRQEQLIHARLREEPLAFVHLRRGIDGQSVPPRGSVPPDPAQGVTSFGVNLVAQRLLSRIRTDLDNFGDVESASLMLDGYLMIAHELAEHREFGSLGAKEAALNAGNWHFWNVHEWLTSPDPPQRYLRRLDVGSGWILKPLVFVPRIVWRIAALLATALAAWGIYALVAHWDSVADPRWPAWLVVTGVAVTAFLVFAYLATKPASPLRFVTDFFASIVVPFLLAPLLWLMALCEVGLNGIYLWLGGYRMAGLSSPPPYDPPAAAAFSKRRSESAGFGRRSA
jgi:predicted acylesterase/phospholipase RssA